MPRAKTRVLKTSTKPRLTITVSPALDRYLKAVAKANQRSRAWVINYAINEIREKYKDDPAPVLQVRSRPAVRCEAPPDGLCQVSGVSKSLGGSMNMIWLLPLRRGWGGDLTGERIPAAAWALDLASLDHSHKQHVGGAPGADARDIQDRRYPDAFRRRDGQQVEQIIASR